jgi:hypothetical protein
MPFSSRCTSRAEGFYDVYSYRGSLASSAYQVLFSKNALVISKRQSSTPYLPMAFNFTREVHDKFAPVHEERIRSALAQLIPVIIMRFGRLQADSIEIADGTIILTLYRQHRNPAAQRIPDGIKQLSRSQTFS